MLGLLTLLLALAAQAGPDVTVYRLGGPVEFTDLYGSVRTAEAAVGCPGGHPELWLSPSVSLETLVHELAHVYDCVDNGAMDGSPTLRPLARPVWASDYCWESEAEWYACSVAHYGSVYPHLEPDWGDRTSLAAQR
ncbi:MAG: hypothetical protein GEU80_00435 [Dehalococcoidia bacterium]|nr:hypothetical protein [Dehalococcoidia bacterium]